MPTNPQDVETVVIKKHLELRDVIEFGDKESILTLTDLMQQGVRQCHNFAFHSEQHGCVRIVAHQCGWLGCRVGEAARSRQQTAPLAGVAMVLGQRHRIR